MGSIRKSMLTLIRSKVAISSKGLIDARTDLPSPKYKDQRTCVDAVSYQIPAGKTAWYPPPMVGAQALGQQVLGSTASYVEKACDLLKQLTRDDYAEYLLGFYGEGLKRYREDWRYADIITVLLALTEHLGPQRYLEVGIRRGRSVCAVASLAPSCELALFDMWIGNYAGMDNPGPELVRHELAKVGHRGNCEFIDGNSHDTLPRYFAEHSDAVFDLITVDGDHSSLGAAQDLCDVLPYLAVGGAIVFDDIGHPRTPELREVWCRIVADDPRFSSWAFDEVGYGVAFAIRKW